MNRQERRDRIFVGVAGLLCAAGGVLGLLQSYGAFGEAGQSEPLLLDDARSFVGRNEAVFWPLVAVGALLIAYLGARWLRAELRSVRRAGPLDASDGTDSLLVDLAALADVVRTDLEREPGIGEADVSITASRVAPSADIRVAVADDLPLRDLRRTLDTGPLPRLARALEHEQVDSRILVTYEPRRRQLA